MRNLVLLLALLLVIPSNALALTPRAQLIRQIEIAQNEISVLQSLINNFNKRRSPKAASYLAIRLSDNKILLEKDSTTPYTIASVTKLMSAIVATEETTAEETITLTNKMLEPLGSSPVLFSGLKISFQDLIKASLIQSSNDAAEALSHFKNHDAFISKMNQKAKAIGMEKSIFYDAHGLNPNNKSTASDLAKMVAYIYQNHPQLLEVTKNNNFWLPDKEGRLLKFANVNNFYYLSPFIGGKTGYLPEASQTLASVFNVNNEPTAIIILRSDNRQADIFAILRLLSL